MCTTKKGNCCLRSSQREGGEHALACWDLINPNCRENCKRNQDVFAAAFPVVADALEKGRSSLRSEQPPIQPRVAAGRHLLAKADTRSKPFPAPARDAGANSIALQERYGPAKPRCFLATGGKDLPVLRPSRQLLLFYSHSAVASVACIHKCRCADSHPPLRSSRYAAAILFTAAAPTECFHPPAPN